MAQTIKDLESRVSHAHEELTDVTDQLLTCNGSDRCPSSSPRGIYKIKLPGITYFEVPCDEDGWMTIQRRIDGSQDFNRTWEDYKNGFGDVKGEFFLGLEKLHRLTDAGQYELNIRIGDVFGNTTSAHYSNFKIGSEEESYPLTDMFGQYKESPAGHALIYNIGKQFSTFDRDNDKSDINCAQKYGGGWWYDKCGISSLNAFYFKVGEFKKEGYGIHWGTWTKNAHKESLTFVEMRIRLKINTPSA
ncbi:ficolin-1-like [Drosophila rhopaloa]|uniref:Ficolin-1-like n=1 Tax=Drosophila rhopaloa TaxID=1041015 RepID=A0A6P4FFY3_DRORH|nr:ficolin-1-like [Drosophila rhopaloa]